MLKIVEGNPASRRSFLRIGTLGGLALSELLRSAAATGAATPPVSGKSIVFVFMHGGPSQFETFDPKMGAPAEIRSTTGELQTSIPGITFGGTFPKLARLANRLSIVRSFSTGDANHDIKPIVGKASANANIGSIYSSVAGSNHPLTGMPSNVALFPRCVDPESQPRIKQFGDILSTGSLGSGTAPFVPGGTGDMQDDLKLHVPRQRLDDRVSLLRSLDQLRRDVDSSGGFEAVDTFRAQAYEMILGRFSEAFDLSREDPRTVAMYDTAPLVRTESIGKRWNNRKFYIDNARTLGKLMLLARRLVERGCGFVTVTTNFVWDMHFDQNNAGVAEGMGYVGLPFDHAISAFLEDIDRRGLRDKVVLVCCGEMGRAPRINKHGGRDHWGRLAPLILAGGGLPEGHVVGQSSAHGSEPATHPWGNANLISTLIHQLFDTGALRIRRGVSPEILKILEHEPITGLA